MRCDRNPAPHIMVDAVRRFEGLELPVVVVAATRSIFSASEVPYGDLSRGRTHLIFAGARTVLDRLRRWQREDAHGAASG